MKKLIVAAVATMLSAGADNAKIGIAPELGLNLASLNGKTMGESMSSGMKIGARIGAVADIGVTENIFVRPGLQFSMLGGKDGDLGDDVSWSLNYLHIPINVLYKLGSEGDGRFYVGLVPYINYALGGKAKHGDLEADIEFGDDEATDDLKSLDFGAGVKVGYELPMGLYVDASFMQGLSNLVPGGDADNKVSNRNISIGVGYFVFRTGDGGGKKKK